MIRLNQTVTLSVLERKLLFPMLPPTSADSVTVYEFNRRIDEAVASSLKNRDPAVRAAGSALRALGWALRRPGYPLSTLVSSQPTLPFGSDFARIYREIDLINTTEFALAGRVRALIEAMGRLAQAQQSLQRRAQTRDRSFTKSKPTGLRPPIVSTVRPSVPK